MKNYSRNFIQEASQIKNTLADIYPYLTTKEISYTLNRHMYFLGITICTKALIKFKNFTLKPRKLKNLKIYPRKHS
jgi:hypothetical protein